MTQRLFRAAAITACALFGYYLSHRLSPPGLPGFFWQIDSYWLKFNFSRLKTSFAILLSLGIPTVVVLYVWLKDFRLDWEYLADPVKFGVGGCLVLAIYGYLTGQTDGRFIWYSHIFSTIALVGMIARSRGRLPWLQRIAGAA